MALRSRLELLSSDLPPKERDDTEDDSDPIGDEDSELPAAESESIGSSSSSHSS